MSKPKMTVRVANVRSAPTVRPRIQDHPFLLFCRAEDDDGDRGWITTGVDSADEGDLVAREYQRIIRSGLSLRCDLVKNSDAATKAWANQSVSRRKALARFGENQR